MIPKKYLPDTGAKVTIICGAIMLSGMLSGFLFTDYRWELLVTGACMNILAFLFVDMRSKPEYELLRKELK